MKNHKPHGFISIIAIGVFALLMIFAINLQMLSIDTMNNIRNNLNQDQAETIAGSAIEYLQWKTKNYEPGLNDEFTCVYESVNSGTESKNSNSICDDDDEFIGDDTMGKNVTMDLKVIGRSTEKLKSNKCGKGLDGGCYVTPIPGTGDAGDEMYCKMYKPNIDVESTYLVRHDLTNGVASVDQVNYSCNWNKLSFGSSQTDRVAVPLYYENALLGKDSEIINPFLASNDIDKKAIKLIVKLRTPCKPCAEGETIDTDYQRKCDATVKDETVCSDDPDKNERYIIDAKSADDIIVQWLINGECKNESGKMEACGIMPIPSEKKSALYESFIFANNAVTNIESSAYEVIIDTTLAHDSNNFPDKIYLLKSLKAGTPYKLPYISKPLLTLFLSKPLLTEGKHNIPYLEYQVLTDQPIGNSKSSLEASIVVEGNAYKKTLTKQIKVPLIDFAIHN